MSELDLSLPTGGWASVAALVLALVVYGVRWYLSGQAEKKAHEEKRAGEDEEAQAREISEARKQQEINEMLRKQNAAAAEEDWKP